MTILTDAKMPGKLTPEQKKATKRAIAIKGGTPANEMKNINWDVLIECVSQVNPSLTVHPDMQNSRIPEASDEWGNVRRAVPKAKKSGKSFGDSVKEANSRRKDIQIDELGQWVGVKGEVFQDILFSTEFMNDSSGADYRTQMKFRYDVNKTGKPSLEKSGIKFMCTCWAAAEYYRDLYVQVEGTEKTEFKGHGGNVMADIHLGGYRDQEGKYTKEEQEYINSSPDPKEAEDAVRRARGLSVTSINNLRTPTVPKPKKDGTARKKPYPKNPNNHPGYCKHIAALVDQLGRDGNIITNNIRLY